jgi:hypothetical protein
MSEQGRATAVWRRGFRFDGFGARLRRGRAGITGAVRDAGEDWRLTPAAIVAILLMPVVVCGIAIGAAAVDPEVYKFLTMEDGPYEWAQFALFLFGAGLAVAVARRWYRHGRRLLTGLFAVAALGLVFVAGEEISWGQRLLGLQTPDGLAAVNTQDELTVHNIREVQDVVKWVLLMVGLYGTVAPMIAYRDRWLSRWREHVIGWVPHPVLIPSFAVLLVWRVYRNLFAAPEALQFAALRFAEVTELVLAIAIVLFLVLQLRVPLTSSAAVPVGRRGTSATAQQGSPAADSTHLSDEVGEHHGRAREARRAQRP